MNAHNKVSILACLALMPLAFVRAQSPQPVEPPAPGAPREFRLPQPTKVRLDNGLRATLVEYGSLPKVTVQLVVRSGELNGGDRTGLAGFTGELMQEGTQQHSASEIADLAAALGGQVSVNVNLDTTTIAGDVLAENAPQLIALIGEIARMPALPEAETERIRSDLLRSLGVAKSQAQSQAREAFVRQVYGAEHPYGRLFPTEEQLASYSAADARAFHAGNFGAQRSHLYVAGKFAPAAVSAAIEAAFGAWQKGPEVLLDVPPTAAKRAVVLLDRPGAPQSTLILGLPVVDPSNSNYVPLQVMNALLGGSFGSRITANIREDKGYTYSPRSELANNYKVATWAELADVTSEHTADSVAEILAEIARLKAQPPPAAELQGIKNYMSGAFVLGNSERGSIVGVLRYMDLHGLGDDYLNTYLARVAAVTPEEVSRLAAEYLPADDLTLVVVGDLATVKPQLAGLDWIGAGDLN